RRRSTSSRPSSVAATRADGRPVVGCVRLPAGHRTPDIRHDAHSGRWVAIAPARAARPGPEQAVCPFCAGHEDLTPPETLRVGEGPTGWDVRVVPNLYPALERHEVVIHGPEHVESFGALRATTSE